MGTLEVEPDAGSLCMEPV